MIFKETMKILTFDVEEWFHLLDNESTKNEEQWNTYPIRIHQNMDRIFDILEKSEQKATFFIVGWIAEKYPEIIKKISHKGYEIGFHTNYHQLIHQLTPEEFRTDVKNGLAYLEDITGKKIISFRAPGFSLTEKCNWAFSILAEMGIEYDSSVFPVPHAHGGYPSFPYISPTLIRTKHGDIKEFPVNVAEFYGKPFVYSGGGYFRLLPYWLIDYFTKKSPYVMSYLHPRDMDSDQPMISDLSVLRKFKSYVGLKSVQKKFEKWISDYEFIDINTASSRIDWEQVPVVVIKN
jgi:polysaccharide deacetylase family protein (PEP-CTERM system associated)